MELKKQLAAIKTLVSQGDLEQGLNQLIALLEAGGDTYAEFAQIIRVNQAEFYQLKAQMLRGTIATEDARLSTNQLTSNTLDVVNNLAAGRTQLTGERPPTRSQAWRYYVAGGIVALALALLGWRLLGGKSADSGACPDFGQDAGLRVMILPFKQTGQDKSNRPEFEIMDGLNDLISQTPQMKAIADVNERYDIETNYPNPAEAADIARGCDAQMLVWGRLSSSTGQEYSIDVRYKLLDAGGVRYSGDTTISRLLTVTDEGRMIQDVRSVTRLLYLVLANQLRTPIASNFIASLTPQETDPLAKSMDETPLDTSTTLILADYYLRMKQPDKAIAEYDKVLEAYPDQATALRKRGALHFEKGDFIAAARDLEAAAPADAKATPELHEARVDAYLQSGQPEKAEKELETIRLQGSKDGAWVDEKLKQTRDSTIALTSRAAKMEKIAVNNPKDKRARVSAAKARNGLGDPDAALRNAGPVVQQDPTNLVALEQVVEAHMQKGDTVSVKREIARAVRAGADVKAIEWSPQVKALLPAEAPRRQ